MSTSCFYLFSVDRFALLANDSENGRLMDATRLGGAIAGFSLGMAAEAAHSMRKSSDGVATAVDGDGLRGFSGTDVVDWLITHGLAGSKDGAVATAGALVRAGVFAHVAGHSNFRVGATRFAFAEDVFFAAVCAAFRSTDGGRSLPSPSGHATLTGNQALFIADCISLPDAALGDDSVRALPHYLEPSYGS